MKDLVFWVGMVPSRFALGTAPLAGSKPRLTDFSSTGDCRAHSHTDASATCTEIASPRLSPARVLSQVPSDLLSFPMSKGACQSSQHNGAMSSQDIRFLLLLRGSWHGVIRSHLRAEQDTTASRGQPMSGPRMATQDRLESGIDAA